MATSVSTLPVPPFLSVNASYSLSHHQPQLTKLDPSFNTMAHTDSSRPRPRLSLNTHCQRTLPGKGTSALRLDTPSTVSPTVRNTYNNTFDSCATPHIPSALSISTTSKPSLKLTVMDAKPPHAPSEFGSSPTSTSSSASLSPSATPYSLPAHVHSILTNSPLLRLANNRSMTNSATAQRLFFPPVKRVTFRAQLAEEIRTSKYTFRHSDLPSREPSPMPLDETRLAPKREASTPDFKEEDDEDQSTTPVIVRRKKIRDWTWTLGPVTSNSAVERGKFPSVTVEATHDVEI